MEEVAAILGASTTAVKVRVHDARRQFERRLKHQPELLAALTRAGDRVDERLELPRGRGQAGRRGRRTARPAASVRLHAHIESCAACRERAALWRGLAPALRGLAPEPPAAMATRRMQIEIERQLADAGRVSRPRWRWRWAPVALGLAGAAAARAAGPCGAVPAPVAAAAELRYATSRA